MTEDLIERAREFATEDAELAKRTPEGLTFTGRTRFTGADVLAAFAAGQAAGGRETECPNPNGCAYCDEFGCPRASPTSTTPAGAGAWRWVPAEITREMQRAYFDVIDKNLNRVSTDPRFGRHSSQVEAYRAMLAAAPRPAPEGEVEADDDAASQEADRYILGADLLGGPKVLSDDLLIQRSREMAAIAKAGKMKDLTQPYAAILLEECARRLDAHRPTPSPAVTREAGGEHHGLDNDRQVLFYEQDFYVLSNFSSFEVEWASTVFKTAEHCYHWLRFATGGNNGHLGGAKVSDEALAIAKAVRNATSAHEAFKLAQDNKHLQRDDWNDVKVGKMRLIIRSKALQHEYVRRKLLATGNRELIENSWRDDFWGWGPNHDGQNMLGKLWMEVRSELLGRLHPQAKDGAGE